RRERSRFFRTEPGAVATGQLRRHENIRCIPVNELRLSYMRSANNVGQPAGGVGPSLASQGFATGPGSGGIVPLAPSIEGIENVGSVAKLASSGWGGPDMLS